MKVRTSGHKSEYDSDGPRIEHITDTDENDEMQTIDHRLFRDNVNNTQNPGNMLPEKISRSLCE